MTEPEPASGYFVTWFHANKLPEQANNLVNSVQIKSVIKTDFTIQFSYNSQVADSISCLSDKQRQLHLITYKLP